MRREARAPVQLGAPDAMLERPGRDHPVDPSRGLSGHACASIGGVAPLTEVHPLAIRDVVSDTIEVTQEDGQGGLLCFTVVKKSRDCHPKLTFCSALGSAWP